MHENGDHGKEYRISDEVEHSKENKSDKNRIQAGAELCQAQDS